MIFFNFISNLKKNSIFKFLSSVRLAVPLMLVLLVTSALGTIYESQYNSDYAKMLIYNSTWFLYLLIVLWINIFCATISRIPFQKHHTGFVITHIGLLTLLGGAFVTASSGVDGQLQIRQNTSENRIILTDLELGYQFGDSQTRQSVVINKKLTEQNEDQLKSISKEFEHLFKIEKYMPFARFEQSYETTASTPDKFVALSFIIKSAFFNVTEWLHTGSAPILSMGPATLKIFYEDEASLLTSSNGNKKSVAKTILKSKPKTNPNPNPKKIAANNNSADKLIVKDAKTKALIKSVSLVEFKKSGFKINGFTVKLKNQFNNAVVVNNKLAEGDGNKSNPALEISIEKDGTSTRDILYGKFPEFSLMKDKSIGVTFSYQTTIATTDENAAVDTNESDTTETTGSTAGATSGDRTKNTIEFYVNPNKPEQARVELYKNNQLVAKDIIKPGQSYQTPWMGITITIGAIVPKAQMHQELVEVTPEKGKDLPPSAILLRLKDSNEQVWFTEGEDKEFHVNNRTLFIFYGRQIIRLPFTVGLDKFSKIDYPGTETPMSYESMVHINDSQSPIKISMNEPLKQDSFTLYQSSYVLNPNEPPVSIFSVNKDPGRPIKYAGSLILSFGIILFTLMRSRYGKTKPKAKE